MKYKTTILKQTPWSQLLYNSFVVQSDINEKSQSY